MARENTRLAYILMRLGIRPGQLAQQTGIDKTLISRWRGGTRRLAPGSEYTKKIVDCIIAADKTDSVISKTLLAYGLDESTGTLRENLDFWLSEQGLPRQSLSKRTFAGSAYTSTFSVFTGPDCIEHALITLYDYIISEAQPTNIIILALDNSQPFAKSSTFVDTLLERATIAGKMGAKTTMIYLPDFVPKMPRLTERWMRTILGGHLSLRLYQGPRLTDSRNLVAARGVACMRVNVDPYMVDPSDDEAYVMMFTEPRTTRHIYGTCESYSAKSTPIFQTDFFPSLTGVSPAFDRASILGNDFFSVSGAPLFAATPGGEVRHLVRASRAAAAKTLAPYMPLFVRPDEFAGNARIRLVFCIESIQEILAPGRVPDPLLSAMLGRPANHSRKLLLTQLAFLLTMLECQPRLTVALLPKKLFARIPIGCAGSAGGFFAAWLPDTGESACFPFANSLFNAGDLFASLWKSLPPSSYDRSSVKRMLSRWLRQNGIAPPQPGQKN